MDNTLLLIQIISVTGKKTWSGEGSENTCRAGNHFVFQCLRGCLSLICACALNDLSVPGSKGYRFFRVADIFHYEANSTRCHEAVAPELKEAKTPDCRFWGRAIVLNIVRSYSLNILRDNKQPKPKNKGVFTTTIQFVLLLQTHGSSSFLRKFIPSVELF